MLDRSKLIQVLHQVADKLFIDTSPSYDLAQLIWQRIAHDATFLYKVRELSQTPWPVPLWQGNLNDTVPIAQKLKAYGALSIDGSQIYPDRHQHVACFLINIGSVFLPYGIADKKLIFDSIPSVFTGSEDTDVQLSTDLVNCRRQELELQAGLEQGKEMPRGTPNAPYVLLFDGSLIFWHLASKDIALRDLFLNTYLALLHQLYEERIPVAWYISMPKSKELVNLVRLYLCDFDVSRTELYEPVNVVLDSTIIRSFVPPFSRTIIFQNRSSVSEHYQQHLRPYFFYLNVGDEIGRVEIPAWIAHDEALVSQIAQVIVDQCIKGHGYPVALAEAHEQAVVKGPDRDFFYHVLQKMSMERNLRPAVSRKSFKKRSMGI